MRGFRDREKPKVITFKYVRDKFNNIIVPRPRVEIVLRNGEKVFRLVMLVDSGADTSFIPLEVAEILELKLGKTHTSRSASGPFETAQSQCHAALAKGISVISLGDLPLTIPTQKIDDQNVLSYALLGRRPFFNLFDVTFRENSLEIILRKPKDPIPKTIKQPKIIEEGQKI